MNADTKAPFGYKDACIELNPHVGGNPTTAEEARKAVSDFCGRCSSWGSADYAGEALSRSSLRTQGPIAPSFKNEKGLCHSTQTVFLALRS